jgi:hypothetical protein
LASEGKSAQQIYQYLTQLGVDEERKRKVISQIFLNESIDFDNINEAKKPTPREKNQVNAWLKKNAGYDPGNDEWTSNDGDYSFIIDDEIGKINVNHDTMLSFPEFIEHFIDETKNHLHEGKGLYEDDVEDLAKASSDDLEKGIDPSKATPDPDVEAALDKLKKGDDEDMEDKKKEDETKDKDEDKSDKVAALQAALKDAEKLDRIKKILSETFDMDFSEETDADFITGVFEYHSIMEKLSQAERDKLKDADFIFPSNRSWPIHDEKHAKTALVWATWPQYKDKKDAIVKAVLKRYPHMKGIGAAK